MNALDTRAQTIALPDLGFDDTFCNLVGESVEVKRAKVDGAWRYWVYDGGLCIGQVDGVTGLTALTTLASAIAQVIVRHRVLRNRIF